MVLIEEVVQVLAFWRQTWTCYSFLKQLFGARLESVVFEKSAAIVECLFDSGKSKSIYMRCL